MKEKLFFIKFFLQNEQEHRRRQEALKNMSLNFGYKENKNLDSFFQKLVMDFHATESYDEKSAIAEEMFRVRGYIPLDIQMELNSMKPGKSR